MQHDILINWSPQETRVALVQNAALQEIHIERSLERGLVGNIYSGRVVRVLPGMQSAFIDIGMERSAFLHVADVFTGVHAKHLDADAQHAPGGAYRKTGVRRSVADGTSHQGPDRQQRCAFIHTN